MADYLLDLSRNKLAKRLLRQLKLPIPLPEPLTRARDPWSTAALTGLSVAIGGARASTLKDPLRQLVTEVGAEVLDTGSYAPAAPIHGLVFDATPFQTVQDLGFLYDFIKPRLRALASSGRVVLLGAAPEAARTVEAAAVSQALLGFGKSLSKEIGRKGSTCQLLYADPAMAALDERLAWPLVYFLSPRSAFISGQALTVSEAVEATTLRPAWQQPLAGKTALVTGAAHGIGAAICRRLAAEGARVVGLDHPKEREALETLMGEIGGSALLFDLLDPKAARLIAAKVESELGSLDILVNNAGITRDKTLARMPRDFWDDTLAINLKAPLELAETLTQGASSLLGRLNPEGRVIFLSSVSGIAGNAGQTNYAAAKAGLLGLVQALAPKVAGRGITVNALAPGFIETRMTQAMPTSVREVARRFNALNQAGKPEDVAEAVVFLAAPGAHGVTGSVLRVCGHNLIGA